MNVLIVGAGKSGSYLAEKLRAAHSVTMVESRPERADYVAARMPDVKVVRGDGCEPSVLDQAGAAQADLVAALTGDDEDNLVVSFLVKTTHQVPMVFARTNHPKNEWMFTKTWGVDVAVSTAQVIYSLDREGGQPRRRHHAHGALRREHGHRRGHAPRGCRGGRQDAFRARDPQVRTCHGDHLGRRGRRAARGYDAQRRRRGADPVDVR